MGSSTHLGSDQPRCRAGDVAPAHSSPFLQRGILLSGAAAHGADPRLAELRVMHHRVARLLELLARVAGPRLPVAQASERLIRCDRCRAARVVPVERHERSEAQWWIRLRCGECEFIRYVVATNAQVARFERDVEVGRAVIASAVEQRTARGCWPTSGAHRGTRARPDRRKRLPSLSGHPFAGRKMGGAPHGDRSDPRAR